MNHYGNTITRHGNIKHTFSYILNNNSVVKFSERMNTSF